jgi:Zn-dependent protease
MGDLNTAEIEQTELLANALDRASTACITVGVITPLAGFIYGIAGFDTISVPRSALYIACWFSIAAALHYCARRTLRGLA